MTAGLVTAPWFVTASWFVMAPWFLMALCCAARGCPAPGRPALDGRLGVWRPGAARGERRRPRNGDGGSVSRGGPGHTQNSRTRERRGIPAASRHLKLTSRAAPVWPQAGRSGAQEIHAENPHRKSAQRLTTVSIRMYTLRFMSPVTGDEAAAGCGRRAAGDRFARLVCACPRHGDSRYGRGYVLRLRMVGYTAGQAWLDGRRRRRPHADIDLVGVRRT
jgi:hypothetical protein